jgi:hypothetical protein
LKIFQLKFLWILFVSALVLLIANILIEFTLEKNNSVGEISVTSDDLQNRFESTLKSFGLKDDWVKKKTEKDQESRTNYPSYKITLPSDLSIPEVLLEVYSEFRKDSLIIESIEKRAGKKSTLAFKENKRILLSAEFNYGKNIKRERGALAFIIKNIELDTPDDSLLIESADKFNVLITPSEENLNQLSFITENRKNFSVIISDEINEAIYKLNASYSRLRILNVIKALSVDYANASFFIIDDSFDFYQSESFDYFNIEFVKRNIKLYRLSDFILLDDEEDISKKFDSQVKELKKGETKVFVLTKEGYSLLKTEIMLFKKSGVKIFNTSEIK